MTPEQRKVATAPAVAASPATKKRANASLSGKPAAPKANAQHNGQKS
jgi:hypothetical protein